MSVVFVIVVVVVVVIFVVVVIAVVVAVIVVVVEGLSDAALGKNLFEPDATEKGLLLLQLAHYFSVALLHDTKTVS